MIRTRYGPFLNFVLRWRYISFSAGIMVLLLAFGDAKAPAVRDMISKAPSAECPASWLQSHPDAHVFLNAAAASLLPAGAPLVKGDSRVH